MALSQILDDSCDWRILRFLPECEVSVVYNEQHRLALEALVSGGAESFLEFLRKERLPCFLSAAELRGILAAADSPACPPALEDSGWEHSATVDGSSLTYFPEVSDVEPPLLELGWPAFTTGSFRGVTRAVAHFQPSYGDSIYRCKETVRRMIRSAKEVIAIVTDSLTDLDIFHDLQETSSRRVPVYIILDQSSLPEFLQMCKSIHMHLDELKHMKVRTITGSTYFLRSGARITGKVHERFMLIDGNRVATGSYRFNWTDGKLNRSNLIELSGQITECFDEEFRILYAQSFPVNTSAISSVRNSGIFDHLLLKTPGTPQGNAATPVLVCMTSTPNTAHCQHSHQIQKNSKEKEDEGRKSSPVSVSSTLGEDRVEQQVQLNAVAAEEPQELYPSKAEKAKSILSVHSVGIMTSPAAQTHHISIQTSPSAHSMVQTEIQPSFMCVTSPSSSSSTSTCQSQECAAPQKLEFHTPVQGSNLKECFCRLAKERQLHYTTIRSKLDHMMLLLAHRREQVNVSLSLGSSLHFAYRDSSHTVMEGARMGKWPRGRNLQ